MIVVSNTSPITNLAAVEQLDLLKKLYTKLIIPQAVFLELTSGGDSIPGSKEAKTFDWIETQQVTNTAIPKVSFGITSSQTNLHQGEAEA